MLYCHCNIHKSNMLLKLLQKSVCPSFDHSLKKQSLCIKNYTLENLHKTKIQKSLYCFCCSVHTYRILQSISLSLSPSLLFLSLSYLSLLGCSPDAYKVHWLKLTYTRTRNFTREFDLILFKTGTITINLMSGLDIRLD